MVAFQLILGAVLLLGTPLPGEETPSGPARGEASPPPGQVAAPPVLLLRVEGVISPPTTNFIRRGLAEARERGSGLLLIELDTPGGLLESTQHIVRALFEAEVPVAVYVSPMGARAASAGTFITLAAHVAAMAPSTTIGAASPVTMSPGVQADTVMREKMMSATESFMRTIAERRGRNMEWAIAAVREGASATEAEALELGVVDLVAASREELLRMLDGREVAGDTLRTEGAAVEELEKNLAERFLGLITRPELMLILLLVAMYGIMAEVTNPGAIIPGVAGVIALVLLLYASAAMPINTAGYVLIALAVALFIAEALTPTFGLLVTAGAVAFFLGGLMVFQDLPEPMALPWGYLVPATVLTAVFFIWIATYALRAQRAPIRTGTGMLVGRQVEVVDRVGPGGGRVFVDGEYWNAVGDEEIPEGALCEIEEVQGLRLKVKPTRGEGAPVTTQRTHEGSPS